MALLDEEACLQTGENGRWLEYEVGQFGFLDWDECRNDLLHVITWGHSGRGFISNTMEYWRSCDGRDTSSRSCRGFGSPDVKVLAAEAA